MTRNLGLKWIWTALAGSVLVMSPACVGNTPSNGGGGGDGADAGGGGGGGGGADAGGDPVEVTVSGTVVDYQEWIANQIGDPLAGTSLATEGMTPPLAATAAADGAYTFGVVPPGSVFYVNAAPGPANYRPTRNEMITVAEAPLDLDLFMVSEAHVDQHYATTQDIEVAGTAIVIGDMIRNNGSPFVDVPLASVTFTDELGAAVPGVAGPYFIGAGNVMDPAITASTLAFGKARVGFLNVPPGSYKINLTYLDGQGVEQTITVPVVTVADGATLQRIAGGIDGGGGGGGGGGGALTFATDVYPDLQRASQGGLSCAVCHTSGGQMAALQYDAPAADVLAAINARNLINLGNPAQSGLLTNPLYETPPDHPNATFASIDNPYYVKWMTWIEQGANP
jgi:hypothetical protein